MTGNPEKKHSSFGDKRFLQGRPLDDCPFFNDYIPEIRDVLKDLGVGKTLDLRRPLYALGNGHATLLSMANYVSAFANGAMTQAKRPANLPERIPGLVIRYIRAHEKYADFDGVAAYGKVLALFDEPTRKRWGVAIEEASRPQESDFQLISNPPENPPPRKFERRAILRDGFPIAVAAPVEDSKSISPADMQRRLFQLQMKLAEIGVAANAHKGAKAALKQAQQLFETIEPDARQLLELLLASTAPLPVIAVTVERNPVRPATGMRERHNLPSENRKRVDKLERQHLGAKTKPLTEYPWFQIEENAGRLEGLKSRTPPISDRKTLVEVLTPLWTGRGMKASGMVPLLNEFVKKTSNALLTRSEHWIAAQIDKLAGTFFEPDAKALDDVVFVAKMPEPTNVAIVSPGPVGDLSAQAVRDAVLLSNLRRNFLILAQHLTQANSVDEVWMRVPETIRPEREMFVGMLNELADSRQPFSLTTNSGMKPIAAMLSSTFTPGGKPAALWADCEKITGRMRLPQDFFSDLMSEHYSNLVPRDIAGKSHGVSKQNRVPPDEMRLAILAKLRFMPDDMRAAKVNDYMKVYKAERVLIRRQNLISDAAEIMDLFQIPSQDVVGLMPALRNELIYSDSVREHYPNLAQLMQDRGLFTVSAVAAEWFRIMPPESRKAIYDTLWKEAPDVLRSETSARVVEILAQVFKVDADDIRAVRKIAYKRPVVVRGELADAGRPVVC